MFNVSSGHYFKDKTLIFKCSDCSKYYVQKFDDDLKNLFGNRYKFCENHINKYPLMLRKGIVIKQLKYGR